VQFNQLLAEGGHLAEERGIGREGHAREVSAQFLGVFLAVGRAVEDGVDVGQHLFRRGGEAISGAQFGQQPVGQVGLARLVEHIRRFGGGVEVEGKVVVNVKGCHCLVSPDYITHHCAKFVFVLFRSYQCQIFPGQHVAHDFWAGHTMKTTRPSGVIGIADIKRTIQDGDDFLAVWATIAFYVLLRQADFPITGVFTQLKGFARQFFV
jgi:hypothetical protein